MKRFLAAAAAVLLAGCTAKANLVAVRNSLDGYKSGIQHAETVAAQREGEKAEILSHTSTPKSAPYPALGAQVSTMKAELTGMKAVGRRIEAFKPKFDQYRRGRGEVRSDNEAEWAEYQGVMSEYQVLNGELQGHAGRFNQASAQFDALLKKHGIAKLDSAGLRGELEAAAAEIEAGTKDLEKLVPERKKMLRFAKEAGAGAQLLLDKREVLDQMEELQPGLSALGREAAASTTKTAAP